MSSVAIPPVTRMLQPVRCVPKSGSFVVLMHPSATVEMMQWFEPYMNGRTFFHWGGKTQFTPWDTKTGAPVTRQYFAIEDPTQPISEDNLSAFPLIELRGVTLEGKLVPSFTNMEWSRINGR